MAGSSSGADASATSDSPCDGAAEGSAQGAEGRESVSGTPKGGSGPASSSRDRTKTSLLCSVWASDSSPAERSPAPESISRRRMEPRSSFPTMHCSESASHSSGRAPASNRRSARRSARSECPAFARTRSRAAPPPPVDLVRGGGARRPLPPAPPAPPGKVPWAPASAGRGHCARGAGADVQKLLYEAFPAPRVGDGEAVDLLSLASPPPASTLPPRGSEGQPELGPPGLPPNIAELVQRPARADRQRVAAADGLWLPRAPAVPPGTPHVLLPPPRDPLEGLVGRLQVKQLQAPPHADVRADAQQPRRSPPCRAHGAQARHLRPESDSRERGVGAGRGGGGGGGGGSDTTGKGRAKGGRKSAHSQTGTGGGGRGDPPGPRAAPRAGTRLGSN